MNKNKKILITLGDVSGIGPEIVIKALNSVKMSVETQDMCIVGNRDVFFKTALELGLPVPKGLEIIDIPFNLSNLKIGESTRESGKHSLLSLKKCCELTKDNFVRAIMTAPISKKSLNMAGHHYSGQTEVLKDFLGTGSLCKNTNKPINITASSKKGYQRIKGGIKRVISNLNTSNKLYGPEMMFVAGELRVMLLTRHLKLSEITQNLSTEKIMCSIITLKNSLEKDFKIKDPKIAICGLNPHAGENGVFGLEEEYFFRPAINQLRERYAINVEGPFPADSLWAKAAKSFMINQKPEYDAYVACYHDQGLIPVKMLAMDTAVNLTINLPVIRTSPCHGTAYDIAGKNKADYRSMIESVKLADDLSSNKEIPLVKEKI